MSDLVDLPHAEALATLRAACAAGDRSPTTVLNLAIAKDRMGQGQEARDMMREIAALLPEWDEPWLRIAESWRRENRATEAVDAYEQVLEINPRRVEALLSKSVLLMQLGDPAAARSLLIRCIGVDPANAQAWHALGLALLQEGNARLAETAFAEASKLAPEALDFAVHRVEAAAVAGTLPAELTRLRAANEADPLNPAPLTALALGLERDGRPTEAADMAEAAATLAPTAALPATMAGVLLARAGRLREAEARLAQAVSLDPDNPIIRNDHAAVLMRMQRHAAAHEQLQSILDCHGPQTNVLCNLATALISLGRQEEGVRAAEQATGLDGGAYAWRTLANAMPYHEATTSRRLVEVLTTLAGRLPASAVPRFAQSADPDRRLRVGLLSGSMRAHPVGWLTIAGFETLDPDKFEIICLAQATATDSIARRFRAIASEWVDIAGVDDPGVAALAREREIDILIDLGGFGDSGRLPVCRHHAAPVQIKWVGMQNHSTGVPEIRWIISDKWETPPELEQLYTEKVLLLPDGYICYSPPPYAPDPALLPALRNGYVTFGCFNNLAKITPTVLRVWGEILQHLPSSRLILKTHQFSEQPNRDRIRQAFAELGIASERLELRGASPHRAFMGEYNDVDLVLDPFPYCGGLTTCEALWMGVPTVTLPGEIFASRHSASHLSNAGLPDWVARDLQDYQRIAIERASDIAALADLRGRLRAQVKASPLCDAPRFGRNLGHALRFAWKDWCARC